MLRDPEAMPANAPIPSRTVPGFVRAQGVLRARFRREALGTEAAELRESGGFRIRFPRVHGGPDAACETVMINTGGGMTGGDRLSVDLALEPGARVVATTQSAEKVYRSDGPATRLDVRLTVAAGAQLAWLPQEQILFSGARLARRMDVDLADDARLTLAEAFVFGRVAMGETLGDGLVDDRWRIRRGGRLLLAENLCLAGPLQAALDRPAVAAGMRAVATVVHVAPDAEARLEEARAVLEEAGCDCGASAWRTMLVLRFAAAEPSRLRADLARFLNRFRAVPLPRVWQC
ncbi:MAG: urease accessory protein UreD [Alsobacter sp.]